jgi:hypothetical protein
MYTRSTPIYYSLGNPSQSNETGNGNKRIQIGKEIVKLSLFAVDITIYLKDSKYSIRKLLDTINSFNKVADTKSIYKNPWLFYTPTKYRLRKNMGKSFHLK